MISPSCFRVKRHNEIEMKVITLIEPKPNTRLARKVISPFLFLSTASLRFGIEGTGKVETAFLASTRSELKTLR